MQLYILFFDFFGLKKIENSLLCGATKRLLKDFKLRCKQRSPKNVCDCAWAIKDSLPDTRRRNNV